jgi:hypothetical protein
MIAQGDMAEFRRSLLRCAALLLAVQTAIWINFYRFFFCMFFAFVAFGYAARFSA